MKRAVFLLVLVLAGLISYRTLGRIRDRRWHTRYDAGQTALAECRYPEAREQLDGAVELARGFGERDPRLAWSLMGLGYASLAQAQDAEAERLFGQALAMLEKLPDGDGRAMADCLTGLGTSAGHRARDAEAERLLRRALAIRQEALGAEHPDVGRSLFD